MPMGIKKHRFKIRVRNKTIIGLKFAFPTFANDEVTALEIRL